MGYPYNDDTDTEIEERRKRFREGRKLSDDELLHGWSREPGTYGGIPKPDLPVVNFITYKDKYCTKQKRAYCIKNNECFPLRSDNTAGWSSGLIEAKDGSFLATGFVNKACELSQEKYEKDKKSAKKEDSEEVSHKSLIRLLGQDQCFSSNFNGVLGNKTKAFIFWLDTSCHENATYLSFSGDTPYGGKRGKSHINFFDGLGSGLGMFICILFTIFTASLVMGGRHTIFNKRKSREHPGEQSRLVEDRDSFEIEHSAAPPLPAITVHRKYQEGSLQSVSS